MLEVRNHNDIINFCNSKGIDIEKFNEHVRIPFGIKSTSHLFFGCKSFNQPVDIPSSVKWCMGMFEDCTSFNQEISIPNGVVDCSEMFKNCRSLNSPVKILGRVDIIENSVGMFAGCTNLKQIIFEKNDH